MEGRTVSFIFVGGMIVGIIFTGLLIGSSFTSDILIENGKEFYLKGAVRKCEVVHDLKQ